MKKTILFVLLNISLVAWSQDRKATDSNALHEKPHFTCQHVELKGNNDSIIMRQNVKINFGDLYAEADSVIFKESEQSLVAYQVKHCVFKGGVAVFSENPKNTIRYRLNDKTMYME